MYYWIPLWKEMQSFHNLIFNLRCLISQPTKRRVRMNKRLYQVFSLLTILALMLMALPMQNAQAVSTSVVISQVYGGAGCGTVGCSTYKNDYIELHNVSNSPVSINGWSVQYSAAAGTSWQVTNLPNVSIAAGQYFLVAEGAGAN